MARGESLIRQWRLLKALQGHRFGIALDELAARLECSRRQVQRDLDVLQQVGFPIEHEARDFGKRYWRLTDQFVESEGLVLSVTEMLSLHVGQQLLAPLAGTAFGDGLAGCIEKIRALLPGKALRYFDALDRHLWVKPIAGHDYSGQQDQIRLIQQALEQGRVLSVRYRSASEGRTLQTLLQPYGLVVYGLNLYCIGYLEAHEEIRTLKVTRFQQVALTDQRFQRPATFSLRDWTQGAFGVFAPGQERTIRLRLSGWAATSVREMAWHPSQRILEDHPQGPGGGELLVKFTLSDTTELKRWVLGFGVHAQVLAPQALAEQVAQELAAALAAYRPEPTAPAARPRRAPSGKMVPKAATAVVAAAR